MKILTTRWRAAQSRVSDALVRLALMTDPLSIHNHTLKNQALMATEMKRSHH